MKKEKLLLICSAVLALGAGTAMAGQDDAKPSGGGSASLTNTLAEGEVTLYTTLGAAQSGDHSIATVFNCVHYDPANKLEAQYPIPVRIEFYDDQPSGIDGCSANIPDADFDPIVLVTNTVPLVSSDCDALAAGFATQIAARVITTKKAAPYVECSANAMSTTAAPSDRIYPVHLTRVGPKLRKVRDTFP